MDSNMENDYREKWCQFFCAIASRGNSAEYNAWYADNAINELKKRDNKKFFDQPEKGYR